MIIKRKQQYKYFSKYKVMMHRAGERNEKIKETKDIKKFIF